MGTWSEKIDGNDTFCDVYDYFFEMYNEGESPEVITAEIRDVLSFMFEDYDDEYPSLFALALAQWETKSLQKDVFEKVKSIIENGEDLEKWRKEGIGKTSLKKREKYFNDFLAKISKEKPVAKRRKKTLSSKASSRKANTNEIIEEDKRTIWNKNRNFYCRVDIDNADLIIIIMIYYKKGGKLIARYQGGADDLEINWLGDCSLEIKRLKEINFRFRTETCELDGKTIKITYF